ncbi:OmpA family protein [Vibrio parahaemolyticus]|nr:OmpA family protein [Vibrio parahaemolyticus]
MKKLYWFFLLSAPALSDPLSDISWSIDSSLYRCDLKAELPYKNLEMYITSQPEEPMSLTVHSRGFELFGDDVELTISTPYWSEKGSHAIHVVNIDRRNPESIYSVDDIEQALERLKDGFWISLDDGRKSIEFPSLDMESLAVDFRGCQSAMPLLKFDTAKDIDLLFGSASHRSLIKQGGVDMLDALASVILKDQSVAKVLVDGHTDNLGDEIDNLELSHKRASYVAMQLVDRGIPVDKIEIRAHGERYPEFSNRTIEGRQKNRRVNVRLVKGL